ncbi:hypothetical protein [Sandaracinus amylolyticus]|nr:hypothetical protein [Sandaracinus amylolyticus]
MRISPTIRTSVVVLLLALASACGGDDDGPGGGGSGDAGPPDSGEPTCRGVADSCDLFAGHCEDQDGCFPDGECSGVPRSCSAIFTPGECGGMDGCDWSDGRCSGFPAACSTKVGEGSCAFQLDCVWTDGCQGRPLDCDFRATESECLRAEGCRWE